ncbi:MAG: murein biosynthesis integral membrane protein MurJ [Candidatus Levybacteria bacterium RIFCSPHIGHO2_01_FULL_38_26]|nr:MAG: murein biosynthesis integral membrane protein MurJ [Candidatus Levybacteria bacterium RIFCSPHIGHO2_01_FULL_38_26]
MPHELFRKGFSLLLKSQTNILSAAFIIMVTIILSQILGLIKQRLLVSIFGASDTLGIYLASTRLPDFLFQLIIAGALASAFIPIFSDYLSKNKVQEAHKMASSLLAIGVSIFAVLSAILFVWAPFFLTIFNLGSGFSNEEMNLMANLTRIIIFGQLLFIIGTFFSALLQSYNHFFIPGIAAALYNLGIITGIITLSSTVGIFSPAYGVLLGALFFIIVQLPMVKKIGFSFKPTFSFRVPGVLAVLHLMWPRTVAMAIFQMGTIAIVAIISFLPNPGRNYVIFDYAQTLAFAPIVLFGQSIAQAAFPILSREKNNLENFKTTFVASFNQILYLILPVSVLLLVLRIPIVRLIFGAGQFDWEATVLTGKTLAFFSISLFAQALIYLVSRGFYALHDTKTPLYIGATTTAVMIALGFLFIFSSGLGIESMAAAYSIATIINLVILFIFLDRKVGGFKKTSLIFPILKIFSATFFTGFALYIPIKLLDQLVFDTTRTINLIMLTGISAFAGLSLYLFLTWLFNVKEATTFLLIFKKIGNWREVLKKSDEVIDATTVKP